MKKAVITGGTGMIGRALVNYLSGKDFQCLLLVRPNSTRADSVLQRNNIIKKNCALADLKNFDDFSGEWDVFFHLGWEKTTVSGRDDVYEQLKNVEYTLDAVSLAKKMGVKTFVGAGSQAEYGVVGQPLTSSTPCMPESGYGIAKLTANLMSRLYSQKAGIKHVWARILSIYGENDGDGSLISYLIRAFKNGEVPKLTRCEQIWDYMYSDDCARALYCIFDKGVSGKSYPLGSGDSQTLRSYVECIRDIINPNAEIEFGAKDYYPHQPMFLSADITELSQDTGFMPEYNFIDGIKRAVMLKEELL